MEHRRWKSNSLFLFVLFAFAVISICSATESHGDNRRHHHHHHHEEQQLIGAERGNAEEKNEKGKGTSYASEGQRNIYDVEVHDGSNSNSDIDGRKGEESITIAPEQALVDQAISYLHRLDPRVRNGKSKSHDGGITVERHNEVSRGLTSYVRLYLKQAFSIFLMHNPASLEEPTDESGTSTSTGKEGFHPGHLKIAVEALEIAANKGNQDAIYLLAQMNFYGNWTHPRNYRIAFKRYKQLADLSENATAQHMVGFLYATGFGGAVERDQAKALLYHSFAALNGDIRSEMTIAFRHHSGIGGPRSCDKAAYHYKNVADKALKYFRDGPPGGRYIVRHNYRLADDEGGVYGEGASYISSGINSNKPGRGSTEDLDNILEYWDLMAGKGNVDATYSLGKMYYEGERNMPRNLQKAKSYFLSIVNKYWTSTGKVMNGVSQGLEKWAAKAAGQIGKMYLRGEGVPQDYRQAIKWFKRGVANGDYYSQNGLGYMYLHGLGVSQDTLVAAKYFQAATDQDYAPAQVNLGKLFLEQNDAAIAIRYFELAARHGHVESYYYLAEIYNSGKGRERSCGMATAYYKIVAERVEAIHSDFEWTNKMQAAGDSESALIGYMMGAEQGYESAQANVAYILDTQKFRLSLVKFLKPVPTNSSNQELALIYWTRSAKQSNVDSLVKMGDYYLAGIGAEPDLEKAAACYQAASEFQQSAQALWNLGWMHENGLGIGQDLHIAKKIYDQALETDPVEAYLPVMLSLLKLRMRSFWNTITGGGINDIGIEDRPKKDWSFREFLRKWNEEVNAAEQDEVGGAEGIIDDKNMPMDEEVYHDVIPDDEFFESLAILVLATALIVLIHIRQQRQQQQRINGNRILPPLPPEQAPLEQPQQPVGAEVQE